MLRVTEPGSSVNTLWAYGAEHHVAERNLVRDGDGILYRKLNSHCIETVGPMYDK